MYTKWQYWELNLNQLPKAFTIYCTFTITFHGILYSFISTYIYLRHFHPFNHIFYNIKWKSTAISKVPNVYSSFPSSTNILNKEIFTFLPLLNIKCSNLYLHSYTRPAWGYFSSDDLIILNLYVQNQQRFVRLYIRPSTIVQWLNCHLGKTLLVLNKTKEKSICSKSSQPPFWYIKMLYRT